MSTIGEVNKINNVNGSFTELTLGQVIDTNDPQQMGRIRVACPYLGDDDSTIVSDLPWASPISPLAGSNESAARGRGSDRTPGPIAYGFFNVPKVGATVLVACIEGDPRFRIFLGCLADQFLPHTMPHGRYTYNETPASSDTPSGPLSSTDDPIQPLFDSQTETFTKNTSVTGQVPGAARNNFEGRTRGADVAVSGVQPVYIESTDVLYTSEPDDQELAFTEPDGNIIDSTQGYHRSRVQEDRRSSATGFVYDPQVYSWTTPGFHSISMSDNADNCRTRFRTTHGHQIIMDDTNERIYISTAGGKTYLELDEKGNIHLYGERNISIHAERDINFTAGDTIRMTAVNGVHLASENEVRIHAQNGILHLKSGASTEVNAIGDLNVSSSGTVNVLSAADTLISAANIHVNSNGTLNLQAGASMNLLAGGEIIQTGVAIHLNGPGAGSATAVPGGISSSTFDAWWTNFVPEHEPWARVMTLVSSTDMDMGNTHTGSSEFPYNDPNVGRTERGFDLTRNNRWHR